MYMYNAFSLKSYPRYKLYKTKLYIFVVFVDTDVQPILLLYGLAIFHTLVFLLVIYDCLFVSMANIHVFCCPLK